MPRVVITGYGAITPLGHTATHSWKMLTAGQSGIGPITLFNTSRFAVKVAGEVKDFHPAQVLGRRAARRLDRFEQLANVAASEALIHSGLTIDDSNRHRIGLSVSCAFGGLTSMIEQITALNEHGPSRVNPFGLAQFMTTAPSINIAHGLQGPSFSVASACASGIDGIGMAYQFIRLGDADMMLAGGADAAVNSLSIATFDQMRACSHREEGTPSPFSLRRDGLVIGEGAGVLVLESLEHAERRGAVILAELAAYAANTDAYHVAAPLEEGELSAAAMVRALEHAGISPEEVDYINAHGTGTLLNDPAETKAVKRAFGQAAYDIPVSSTKSATGHMMAGSGAFESIVCIQAIQHSVVPPTINYNEPDPDCDLDYVPNQSRQVPVRIALNNASGFGGHNSVLIFREWD